MKQRTMSLIMALVMTLTLLPATVWAIDDAEWETQTAQTMQEYPLSPEVWEEPQADDTPAQKEPIGELESEPRLMRAAAANETPLLQSLTLSDGIDKQWSNMYYQLSQKDIAFNKNPSIRIDDVYSQLYADATAADGYTVVIKSSTAEEEITIDPTSNYNTRIPGTTGGPESWILTVIVRDKASGEDAETYTVTLKKRPTLKSLSLSVDGTAMPLSFSSAKAGYTVIIPANSQQAQLSAVPSFDGYSIVVNGSSVEDPSNITVDLNGINTIQLAAESTTAEATAKEYTISLDKRGMVSTTVSATPSNALVAIYDSNGDRVWGDASGAFPLMAGSDYTYLVTCKGYIGQSDTFQAGEGKETLSITLEQADTVTHGSGTGSHWDSFRGNADNNGVINIATPIHKTETTLRWAEKLGAEEGGDGKNSGQLGCPILITENGKDYLIVYSGTTLYKVDAATGEVKASGSMVESSEFSITPPTYGAGMLFVGLKDGRVQAFDAATLTSLWVYQDPLGGQPNCPITYHDGYIYTGFWKSETDKANFVCLSVDDEDPTRTNEAKTACWTYAVKGGFYWAGAYVCDDYLLVGADDGKAAGGNGNGRLLCLDPHTGRLLAEAMVQGDVRSSIAKEGDAFYFTTKGGYFYKATLSNGESGYTLNCTGLKLENGKSDIAMSTSTPVVYNGRAYIGVCGQTQFTAYSGHNITVIDLNSWEIAYRVETKGYPQTSGLLTTAYTGEDETVYVYFFENFTPGTLRLLKDRPNQTKAELVEQETYTIANTTYTVNTAYPLFTPSGNMAQYAICSPIADDKGTLYFKNDSGYLMAIAPDGYPKGDVNGDYVTDVFDLQRLYEHWSNIKPLSKEALAQAGFTGTITDVQDLYAYLTTGKWDSQTTT